MLGTVRKNKAELPEFKNKELHGTSFYFTKDTTILNYVAKKHKNVLLKGLSVEDSTTHTVPLSGVSSDIMTLPQLTFSIPLLISEAADVFPLGMNIGYRAWFNWSECLRLVTP